MDRSLVRQYGVAVLLVGLLIGSFALSWFHLPFVVVQGSSMRPTYETGDIVTVGPTSAETIQKGDIVVVDVPRAAEREYGYPDRIIHRVIEIHSSSDQLVFRTKGDNTGEDPFAVYPQNIEGGAGQVYPDLGYIVLYLKSIHGKIFIFSVFLIEFIYSTAPTVRRETGDYIDAFVDRHSPSQDMDQKIDELEEEVQHVDQSLDHFAEAMDEYATHLESHTAAVKNMAQAADDIQQSVQRQTDVLDRMEDQVETRDQIPLDSDLESIEKDDTASELERIDAEVESGVDEDRDDKTEFEWDESSAESEVDRDHEEGEPVFEGRGDDTLDPAEDSKGASRDSRSRSEGGDTEHEHEWISDNDENKVGEDGVESESEFEWVGDGVERGADGGHTNKFIWDDELEEERVPESDHSPEDARSERESERGE